MPATPDVQGPAPARRRVLSCRTTPRAYVAILITEGSRTASAAQLLERQRHVSALTAAPMARCTQRRGHRCPHLVLRPRKGQATERIANTSPDSGVRWPRSGYSYCMISPIRGDFTSFRVQVHPRTHTILR